MWVDKKYIFPIPCCLGSSNLWWLKQIKISLYGCIVTFDLILFILLSPSRWCLFYKFFVLLSSFFFFHAIQGYLIFALFQCLLPRLILQLPGNSEFLCFEFILVVFERLYISPISVSDLSESFSTYFSQTFLMDSSLFASVCCFSISLCPCLWQGGGTRWSRRSLPTHTVLWFSQHPPFLFEILFLTPFFCR